MPCRAFFPFSTNLDTWPLPASNGTQGQTSIGPDALFGGALNCTAVASANASLPAVPYGANGPFSINLWMRTTGYRGQDYSYVFNHMGTYGRPNAANASDWGLNQVRQGYPISGNAVSPM